LGLTDDDASTDSFVGGGLVGRLVGRLVGPRPLVGAGGLVGGLVGSVNDSDVDFCL